MKKKRKQQTSSDIMGLQGSAATGLPRDPDEKSKGRTPPRLMPLPPPQGYSSWLKYADDTMDTRQLQNDHGWGNRPQWPGDVNRQDFKESAKAELAAMQVQIKKPEAARGFSQ